MICIVYNHYAHQYLHKTSVSRAIYNYTQWEHCSTPLVGSSSNYKQNVFFFSSRDRKEPVAYYYHQKPQVAKKILLTNARLIYSDQFSNKLDTQGYEYWKKNIDLKSI